MSPIAQSMRVSATIGKKWLQKVAVGVLDHMEQQCDISGKVVVSLRPVSD